MDTSKPEVGSIAWTDLTVDDAEAVSDFYARVVGWRIENLDMGGYSDKCMQTLTDKKTVAGICHRRGPNVDLPAQWLVYIIVADVDASAARCRELGGQVVAGPKAMGEHGRYCVICDPAGAVAALYQPAG